MIVTKLLPVISVTSLIVRGVDMRQERSLLRASLRLSVLTIHLTVGLMIVFSSRLRYGEKWFDTDTGKQIIQSWTHRACRILAIEVQTNGVLSPVRDTLYVANHISWIDIIGLSTVLPAKFIAKDTVKSWPVIGTLATMTGNLFIMRERRFSLNGVIDNIRQELNNKNAVLIFPEGTTTDGWNVSRFYTGLFSSVSNTEHVIQAIALDYQRHDRLDKLAPYIGEDNFVAHLFTIASLEKTCLQIKFGVPFISGNMSRHDIASTTYTDIINMLNEQRGNISIALRKVA